MFAATALHKISSILKRHFKFQRNRQYVVAKYSKTFLVKKSQWEMKGTPNVEPSNSWSLIQLPFCFSVIYLQGIFTIYLGEGERKI